MNADDAMHPDEQFADWLAAFAEALADGASPKLPDPNVVPAELRPRMHRRWHG
ncbi:MAG TPA: hypothetical protein VGY58_00490 [Gemmataceae bacterium]|nr:hypothetical protein [Gemmataceae bacterium]